MKWTDRGGDLTKHESLVCDRCGQTVVVNQGSGLIFNHPVRPSRPGEHPEPPCENSGVHYQTGRRGRQLPGWSPHREGAGCEVTHLLGSVLKPDPRKAAWSARRFGAYASPYYRSGAQDHTIRIPRDRVDFVDLPGVPDEDTWLRLLIPQLHEITGSITAAYRCARDMAVYLGPARDLWTEQNTKRLLEAVFGEVHDELEQ